MSFNNNINKVFVHVLVSGLLFSASVLHAVENESSSETEKKVLYWVAPMDPAYQRDKPGKSPMGMDLVPVYEDEMAGTGDSADVVISPAVVNSLGVRTETVTRGALWRKINTVGYVDFDENKISHIHMRTSGWIEKLLVKSEGERVQKGQLLFELYSPELVNAQEEFVLSLNKGGKTLVTASQKRLEALGISSGQIKRVKKTRKVEQLVSIFASQDGVVSALNVREGMYITPAMEVMMLADLSSVWLVADIFEHQVDWVKEGQPAEVHLPYMPEKIWEGTLEYVYPILDAKTRALKVRLHFDNPDEKLKPNMFAHVAIYGGPKRDVISIPREALIQTIGFQRVIIALGNGRFEQRKVRAGTESGDWVEIVSGLKEGEKVVVSAQFMLDSEASLKASFRRMTDPKNEPDNQDMKDMDQGSIK